MEKIKNKYLLTCWNGRNPSKFDRFAGMTRIKARLAEGNYWIVQSQGSLTIIYSTTPSRAALNIQYFTTVRIVLSLIPTENVNRCSHGPV